MVEYKFYYFNARGRGELIRYVFAAAGQKYEDVRFSREEWPQHKPRAPFGQAPFLEVVDGDNVFVISQSVSIARYLARKFNLGGKNENEQGEADMYADQVTDLLNEMVRAYFEKDEARKAEMDKKFAEETLPNNLKMFDGKIAKNGSGYLLKSGLSYADLYLFAMLEWLGDKRQAVLENFSNVKDLDLRIRAEPNIANWLETRPKTDM